MKRMKCIKKIKNFYSKKKILGKIIFYMLCFGVLLLIFVLLINAHMVSAVKKNILTPEEAAKIQADCILVLGAGVRGDNTPSNILEDRLLQGIELYQLKASDRLLMSGDHGRVDYDEVNVMKQFAMDQGVPSSHIFMDHAGFSTYESMYRARDVFQVQKVVIVTQKYHLYRALYIAKKLGLEAYGVASDPSTYAGQNYRDMRELLARTKDFMTTVLKPKPTYLGDAIPVSGDGDATNDDK